MYEKTLLANEKGKIQMKLATKLLKLNGKLNKEGIEEKHHF